jgi:hypothetical protein
MFQSAGEYTKIHCNRHSDEGKSVYPEQKKRSVAVYLI